MNSHPQIQWDSARWNKMKTDEARWSKMNLEMRWDGDDAFGEIHTTESARYAANNVQLVQLVQLVHNRQPKRDAQASHLSASTSLLLSISQSFRGAGTQWQASPKRETPKPVLRLWTDNFSSCVFWLATVRLSLGLSGSIFCCYEEDLNVLVRHWWFIWSTIQDLDPPSPLFLPLLPK